MGLCDWSVQYEKGSRRPLSLSDSSRYLSVGTLRNHRRGRHFRGHVTICNGHVHVSSAADAEGIAAAMAAARGAENGESQYRNSIFVDAVLAGDEHSDEEEVEEDENMGYGGYEVDEEGQEEEGDADDDDDEEEEGEEGEEEPSLERTSVWNPSALSHRSRPASNASSRRRGGGSAAREARRQYRDDIFLAMLQRVGDAAVESLASSGRTGDSRGGSNGERPGRSQSEGRGNAAPASSAYELWDPDVDFDFIWDTVQPLPSARATVPNNFRSRGAGNA